MASCSDDTTARTWSVALGTTIHVMRGHTKEIYTLKWSPTGRMPSLHFKPTLEHSEIPPCITWHHSDSFQTVVPHKL